MQSVKGRDLLICHEFFDKVVEFLYITSQESQTFSRDAFEIPRLLFGASLSYVIKVSSYYFVEALGKFCY